MENEEYLGDTYTPGSLPERDDEIDRIHRALSKVTKGIGAKNMLVFGKTGQGKTAGVKYELNNLQQFVEGEDSLDLTIIYLSLESANLSTTFQIATRLYYELKDERLRGISTDEAMECLFEAMNEVGGPIIFVFDEIDQLETDDKMLYTFPRAKSHGSVNDDVYPSLIGISNDLKWRDNLSPKVKSSLYEDRILFRPYDATDLKQILYRRAAKAFKDTKLIPKDDFDEAEYGEIGQNAGSTPTVGPEVPTGDPPEPHVFYSEIFAPEAIPLIASMAAKDSGDARQGLNYLRKAGEIAEQENARVLDEETVREAQTEVDREEVFDYIVASLNEDLYALSVLIAYSEIEYGGVETKPAYSAYRKLRSIMGEADESLSKRRFRDHLDELAQQKVANKSRSVGGRPGGPGYKYKLNMRHEMAKEALFAGLPDGFQDEFEEFVSWVRREQRDSANISASS
jgi:cell division control protein 6